MISLYNTCRLETLGGQRNWLRHRATRRKVAASIPVGVFEVFHRLNPPCRTMALRSSHPLT